VAAVEVHQVADVDIADAIAVRAQEDVIADVPLHPLDPAPGHRLRAGVSQRHVKVLLKVLAVVRDLVAGTKGDGEVTLHRLVIEEVLLDHVASVAKAEHEVLEAVMGVELHDVPQQRMPSHLHQGLGPELGLLSQASALPATEDDYLHVRGGK